jgi:hypothetical protein
VHAKGGDDIEKKTENKTKEKNRGDDRGEKTEERTQKKKPRTKGGETEKRGRKRAFCRCLHCYLRFRLRLHQVKSSSSL